MKFDMEKQREISAAACLPLTQEMGRLAVLAFRRLDIDIEIRTRLQDAINSGDFDKDFRVHELNERKVVGNLITIYNHYKKKTP